jgi:hypothetical protein
MSFIADALIGHQIVDVLIDSEISYITLTNGTLITVSGLLVVEPRQPRQPPFAHEART